MSAEEFITSVLEPNFLLYIFCLISSVFIYYLVYKKYFISVLDPLFLSAIFSLIGCSVVLLLYTSGNIKGKYFFNYLFTQASFFLGFILFSKLKLRLSDRSLRVKDEELLMKWIFIMSSFIYIGVTLMSYRLLGIPLFQSSRLDINANAQGGLGILSRFSDISGILCIYGSISYFFVKTNVRFVNILKVTNILFFLVFSTLSGSKSSFMLLPTLFFCYAVVNKEALPNVYTRLKKSEFKFIFGATLGAFIVMSFSNENFLGTLISLLIRLIGSGDVYWLAYPNGTIERLNGSNAFVALFQSFLGFFRIIPHSKFPEPLGYTLSSYFYNLTNLTGANARHNIFGYVYFGEYGCYLFSFILGSIIGIVRSLFLRLQNQGIFYKLLIILLYINIFSLEGDVTLYSVYLNNILLVFFVLFIFVLMIYYLHLKRRGEYATR